MQGGRRLILPLVAATGAPMVLTSPQGALAVAGSETLVAEPRD